MQTDALIQAGLNLIGQALSIYDSDLKLAHSTAHSYDPQYTVNIFFKIDANFFEKFQN